MEKKKATLAESKSMKKNRPALIAGIAGLALCLGLGAVGASAAELSNGGFMVRSVSGNDAEFVGYAGQRPEAAVVVPEQPVSKPWGDLRFDGCKYGSIFWRGAMGIADKPEDPPVNITTEVEWIADGKVYNSKATTWPMGYANIHHGSNTSYTVSKGQVVGARMRYVAADNPSKATRWMEVLYDNSTKQCSVSYL